MEDLESLKCIAGFALLPQSILRCLDKKEARRVPCQVNLTMMVSTSSAPDEMRYNQVDETATKYQHTISVDWTGKNPVRARVRKITRSKGRDEQPFAQLFPAPPSPVMKVSGLNSAPVGPERSRSHTPASRSICTLRGTYLDTDPELTSEKYVSTCRKMEDLFKAGREPGRKEAYAREL